MSKRFRKTFSGVSVPLVAIVCVTVGCVLASPSDALLPGSVGSLLATLLLVRSYRSYIPSADDAAGPNIALAEHQTAEESKLVQDLLGPYANLVASAANRLGEYRNAAVVPQLVNVLDRSAWRTEHGWDEASQCIVDALARIGDGRGLPALNRVRFSRGPEFQHTVDLAIAAITNMRPNDYRTPTNTLTTNKRKGVSLVGDDEPAPNEAPMGRAILTYGESM